MSDERSRVTEERWGDVNATSELRDVFWTSSNRVARYVNRRATGLPDADWLTWLDQLVLRPTGRRLDCLVLGCGEGWLERALAPSPAVRSILAMDVSPKAVDEARRRAVEHGLDQVISYQVANLDRATLPPGGFDVVIAHAVLHHVERLEHVYEQIEGALRPGGLLVINEYVGERRLQYSDAQLERINRIMALLPTSLRRSAVSGEVLERRERPPLRVVMDTDPSEGVRADEVLPVAEQRFDVVLRRDYGGSLMQPLLYELTPNFDDDDEDHSAILDLLCTLEGDLIDHGGLASDYVFVLARRRRDPGLMFELPVAIDAGSPIPLSPWLRRSTLPETGGLAPVQEHLARQVSGSTADPLAWCAVQTGRGRRRPLSTSRARLLDGGPLAAEVRRHFHRLDIGWPGPDDTPVQALFSLGSLDLVDLANSVTVDRLAAALDRKGTAVLVAPCRSPGYLPTEIVRSTVRAAAASLPRRLAVDELGASVPGEVDTQPPPNLAAARAALEHRFEILCWRPLGWALLDILVPLLAPKVDRNRAGDSTLLGLLCLLDAQLTNDGVLPTEFLLTIVRRR